MADSIKDLLHKRGYDEPTEVRVIKEFIRKRFDATAGVMIHQDMITISVSGSSLAGVLRMHLHELQKICGTKKRLLIRIK